MSQYPVVVHPVLMVQLLRKNMHAATNMLAISFARQNKDQVNSVLSDGLAIALAVGVVLGAVLYCVAPAALRKIAGPRGIQLIAPATSYVRIRCLIVPNRSAI